MARVLVADDDTSLRTLFAMALEQAGHEVRVAATASEAVLLYGSDQPDILVLDVHMGGGGGAAKILERLDARETGVTCPIIVVTGRADWETEDPRIVEVLRKPFDMSAFAQAVSSALARP